MQELLLVFTVPAAALLLGWLPLLLAVLLPHAEASTGPGGACC